MPKGGGKIERPRNRPSRKFEGGAENLKDKISGYLDELQAWEQHYAQQRGVQPVDYSLARNKLGILKPHTPTDALFNALFEAGVSPNVVDAMSQELDIRPPHGQSQTLSESSIKNEFFSEKLVSQTGLKKMKSEGPEHTDASYCKRDGEVWLEDFLKDQRTHRHFDLNDAHRLQLLGNNAATRYGSDTPAITRLMFMCAGEHNERHAVERMDRIVTARQLEPETRDALSEPNFFEQMRNFIAVYADITQVVLKAARSDKHRDDIEKTARRTLSHTLQSEEFQLAYWNEKDGPPDTFALFQKKLLEGKIENPWIVADCSNTPFDPAAFGLLITRDAPRGLVAEAAIGLNNYQQEILSLRSKNLSSALPTAVREVRRVEQLPDDRDRKKILGQTHGAFHTEVGNYISMVNEYLKLYPSRRESYPADIETRIRKLELPQELALFTDDGGGQEDLRELRADMQRISGEIAGLTQWRSREEMAKENDVHPIAALLRIASPQKLVQNKALQQDFRDLFEQLETPRSPRQIAIIAASVRDVLGRDDPHLSIPLVGAPDGRSLKTILIEYAQSTFDRDVIRKGPYVHLDRMVAPERPLFIPAYVREYASDPQRLKVAKQHFDSAAGTSPFFENRTLLLAAQRWNELAGKDAYHEMLHYAGAQANQFYGLNDNYRTAFYRSATSAVGDFLGKLLTVEPGKRFIFPNQEFSGITKEFQERGALIDPKSVVYLNDRTQGRALRGKEVFEQFKARIEDGASSKMSVFSLRTRFGDALCGGDVVQIQDLTSLLHEAYPGICLGADMSQSLEDNYEVERQFQRLGFDFGFNSGSKVGIENAATFILRTKYPKGIPSWLDSLDKKTKVNPMGVLQPGASTESIAPIAALGMYMQELSGHVNPWSLDPLPPGMSLREFVTERYRRLTEYFIQKAEGYHHDLMTNPNHPFPVQLDSTADSARVAEQFGMHVIYPISPKSYGRIVTATLPNIEYRHSTNVREHVYTTGAYLADRLNTRGFPVMSALKDMQAIRASFKMIHDQKDIDRFFDTLEGVHVDFLRDRIEEKRAQGIDIQTLTQLTEETLNIPMTWVEN